MAPEKRYRRRRRRGSPAALISIFAAMLVLGWVIQGIGGLERTMLNRHFYIRQAEELALYPMLRASLLEQFTGGREELFADGSVVYEAAEAALSEDWVRRQAEAFMAEALLFVKGQRQRLLLAAELQEREPVFREALFAGLLDGAPEQLARLELPEAALREFINQIDFPDQVILLSLTRDELPEGTRQALEVVRISRGLLQFAPYLLVFLLAALCLLQAGVSGGLKRTGAAALASALSFQLLVAAAGEVLVIRPARELGAAGALELLFGDGPAVMSGIAGAALAETVWVSAACGGAGLLLLAAGFIAGALRRGRPAGVRRNPL